MKQIKIRYLLQTSQSSKFRKQWLMTFIVDPLSLENAVGLIGQAAEEAAALEAAQAQEGAEQPAEEAEEAE